MTDASRRFTLERAVQLTIALTTLVFVLAAGSLLSWLGPARFLRWPLLLALVGLSVALAWRGRGRGPRPSAPFVAAAYAFTALALLSVLWSSKPMLSAAHAGVFALLFVACGALAWAAWGRADRVALVVDGVLLGVGLVVLGGFLLLVVEYDRAVMPATTEFPARFQGLGGGPNTATMVMAIGVPLAAQRTLWGTTAARVAASVLLVLLLGSIVASGSRGAILGAFAGLAVFAALLPRALPRRALAVAAVGAALALAVLATRVPDPLPPGTASAYVPPYPGLFEAKPKPGFVDANLALRLQDDVGHPGLGVADTRRRTRTLLSSSGRAQAWGGTLELVAERPVAGYGFGLEDKVFVDRYVSFNSNVPENSYLGLLLQLGIVGTLALGGLLALSLFGGLGALGRLDPRSRALAAGCAGAVAAGLVLGMFQSFIYAVGNNATAAFWLAAFMLPAAAALPDELTPAH